MLTEKKVMRELERDGEGLTSKHGGRDGGDWGTGGSPHEMLYLQIFVILKRIFTFFKKIETTLLKGFIPKILLNEALLQYFSVSQR